MKLSTKNIHLGVQDSDQTFGSVVPPIYTTSTYRFPNAREGADRFAGRKPGMIYSRFTNPTVATLEKRLAALEGGEMAIATASGMSAIQTTLFHFLKMGDSIVAHKVVYGGTYELITKILPRFGIKAKMIDFKNPDEVEKSIDGTTKILYLESPTNPLLEILDIEKIAAIGKKHKIITIIDNTLAPPPMQTPLKMGIDIVIHALTKYIGGHTDLIGGAIIGPKNLLTNIYARNFIFFGPTMSPYSASLFLRSMATLVVRIEEQSANTAKVAEFLQNHRLIDKVYYPGLASHPQHDLAQKQMSYFGGLLSFDIKGGYEAGERMVNSVQMINLAVSLGAVDSLIEHPASMTHSELSVEEQKLSGISPSLIRLSVGIEDVEDILGDLSQALEKSQK